MSAEGITEQDLAGRKRRLEELADSVATSEDAAAPSYTHTHTQVPAAPSPAPASALSPTLAASTAAASAATAADTSASSSLEKEAEEAYRQRLRKLLTHMSQENLVNILSLMGARYQPVYDEIYRVADSDASLRRLFVRGCAWETSSDALKKAFSEHGDVEEAVVIMDKTTGKSRGFGFVTYVHADSAIAALEKGSRQLDGRTVHVNLASAREKEESDGGAKGGQMSGGGDRFEHRRPPQPTPQAYPGMAPYGGGMGMGGGMSTGTAADKAYRRFFVRGLPWETNDATLRFAFTPYGDIEEAVVIMDKTTNKSRGYGFVTMRWLEGAQAVMMRPPPAIDGRSVEVVLASAKDAGAAGGPAGSTPGLAGRAPAAAPPAQPGPYGSIMGMGATSQAPAGGAYGMMGMGMPGMAYGHMGMPGMPHGMDPSAYAYAGGQRQ